MSNAKSISRAFMLHAGAPMVLVLCLVVGWLTSTKVTDYLEEREVHVTKINQMILRGSDNPEKQIDELEVIHRECLSELNRQFIQDMALSLAILGLGIAVPILIARHLSQLVEANLQLLEDHLSEGNRGGSFFMPRSFDFKEFNSITKTLRLTLRERNETEQRWKRAEKELVNANADLVERANELREGRKVALSMMEDAEMAREELEALNLRLNEAIEQTKAAARNAEIANNAKSDFLATMSHEIRTPLNGVIGFIDMLEQTNLDCEQKDYAESLKSSGEALMALINDILDFSKIESGNLEIEQCEFNLLRMLRELTAMFFADATKKGIQLKLNIDKEVPRIIEGDETRLRQILMNLISNAVKFTESGEVSIHVIRRSSLTIGEPCELEFEVSDTGIGIETEQLEKLFSPFLQADSSTTRKYGGTGLGLAICKRLCEAMNGRVSAKSVIGGGSSFFVELSVRAIRLEHSTATPFPHKGQYSNDTPIDSTQSVTPAAEAKPTKLAANLPLSIAVAEDNIANQRLLELMLKRLGWTADFCDNGQALLKQMNRAEYDLIFMDLQMPVMDGIEASVAIREGQGGESNQATKIIALTANALSGDEDRCLEAGMDAYLNKPIKIDDLKDAILNLFQAD
ncbi:MAG: ATP-binding protein [Coraliomargarita sp.]